MIQKIICRNGKCIDLYNLECEEKFDDIVKLIECELLEQIGIYLL